jgi:hypothetical protein
MFLCGHGLRGQQRHDRKYSSETNSHCRVNVSGLPIRR